MHQAADDIKQEQLKTRPSRSLSTLGKVTAVAIVGQTIAIVVE
jgi:hypothetical protein